ncbi:MAG: hypothetical protein MH204_07465, partial [Fimbriimonadaceae bacterium]|nr:hypothetical protein [Fimbriimonadaceae bacterium]
QGTGGPWVRIQVRDGLAEQRTDGRVLRRWTWEGPDEAPTRATMFHDNGDGERMMSAEWRLESIKGPGKTPAWRSLLKEGNLFQTRKGGISIGGGYDPDRQDVWSHHKSQVQMHDSRDQEVLVAESRLPVALAWIGAGFAVAAGVILWRRMARAGRS